MKQVKKVLGFGPSGNKAVIEMDGERYFSSVETARVLGLCAGSFYALKKRFKLKGVRVGRRVYYNEKDLSAHIFKKG